MQHTLRTVSTSTDDERGVIRLDAAADVTIVLMGDDDAAPDLLCGSCQALLAVGVQPTTVDDLLIECPACGRRNDTVCTATA